MATHVAPIANLVRLQNAFLCANCEVISECTHGRCTACGSQALLGLCRVLGGALATHLPFPLANVLASEEHTASNAFVMAA
jgi:hypothetical protein